MSDDPAVTIRLSLLRQDWEHAYVITYEAGQFCARRRDDGAICRRALAVDLQTEMAADYRARPVLI